MSDGLLGRDEGEVHPLGAGDAVDVDAGGGSWIGLHFDGLMGLMVVATGFFSECRIICLCCCHCRGFIVGLTEKEGGTDLLANNLF